MDGPRVAQETKTVNTMIKMYCQEKHGSSDVFCEECSSLSEYAWQRLKSCKYGEEKLTCSKCPIHCYRPDMRGKIIDVMRYSGPRMIYIWIQWKHYDICCESRKT